MASSILDLEKNAYNLAYDGRISLK